MRNKIKETNASKLVKIYTNDKNDKISNNFERIRCGSNHSLLLSCDGDIPGVSSQFATCNRS